jgi:DNA modification methylase
MESSKEIRFRRDTAMRQDLFTPESFAHPAKMDSQLEIWLIEKFTKPGETILDPMFGSGTAMLACTLGRHVIGVELEEKFVKMAADNWAKVRMMPQLGYAMGNCTIIHGDARNLSGLMADAVITSPPYEASVSDNKEGPNAGGAENRFGRWKDGTATKNSYTEHGEASKPDAILTSPPFGGSEQVDNREFQNDTITSRKGYGNAHREGYGNIEAVITSPPYEATNQVDAKSHNAFWQKLADDPTSNRAGRKQHPTLGDEYSGSPTNIGNLKADNYLSAMAQVYGECFKVLKDGGTMVLVTKNFIREQKEIRLDLDTKKLCQQVGFTFVDRWYRKLPAQSFWRILYKKKFPDAPELTHEDVLVFRKDV